MVPPPSSNDLLPWKLVLGGLNVGSAERFRLSPESMLYSSLLGGVLQCSTDSPVLGYPGVYERGSHFLLEKVPDEEVFKALELSELSSQILNIQVNYLREKKKVNKKQAKKLIDEQQQQQQQLNEEKESNKSEPDIVVSKIGLQYKHYFYICLRLFIYKYTMV